MNYKRLIFVLVFFLVILSSYFIWENLSSNSEKSWDSGGIKNDEEEQISNVTLSPEFLKFGGNNFSNQSIFDVYTLRDFDGQIVAATSVDFNDDGLLDFAISMIDNFSRIIIMYNEGGLQFRLKEIYAKYEGFNSLVSGDFDNDGDVDLIFSSNERITYNNISIKVNGTINILFNKGNGNFTNESLIIKRGNGKIDEYGRINPRVTSADFDDDDDVDILISDNSGKVELFRNDGFGNFSSDGIVGDFGSLAWGLTSCDYDGDGDIDFFVSATEKYKVTRGHIFIQDNNINLKGADFETFPEKIIANVFHLPSNGNIKCIDYDGDQDIDLLVASETILYIMVNDNGSYSELSVLGYVSKHEEGYEHFGISGVAVGDFDGDGFDDFIIGAETGTLRLFLNKLD